MSEPDKKSEDRVVLDLDEYRKRRQEDGTWPPSKEEHENFFKRWKESKKK